MHAEYSIRAAQAGKHVLVEKPLVAEDDWVLEELSEVARSTGAVCVTAYNHRFEPHYMRMRDLIHSGDLGRIFSIRMFYGNGTARLVRDSAWRDQGAGVLPDLGSHLLDTLKFWLPEAGTWEFETRVAPSCSWSDQVEVSTARSTASWLSRLVTT